MINKPNPELADLPDADFILTPRASHQVVSARLDKKMAAEFDAELHRRGLNRNQVVKGWVSAWLAKVKDEDEEEDLEYCCCCGEPLAQDEGCEVAVEVSPNEVDRVWGRLCNVCDGDAVEHVDRVHIYRGENRTPPDEETGCPPPVERTIVTYTLATEEGLSEDLAGICTPRLVRRG